MADVDRWFAATVLRDHNDQKIDIPAGTSVEDMVKKCYDHCVEINCASFDVVRNKNLCYFADGPLSVDELDSAEDPEAAVFYMKEHY